MNKSRVEAFSDGVIAILITIMVLDFKIPHGDVTAAALKPLLPVFLCYVLSFINIGIYWTNHHHLFQAAKVVDGKVLLANLHLLFWLSLIPFGMGWMGENDFPAIPVAAYGAVLLMCGVAYSVLCKVLIKSQPTTSPLAAAIGSDVKGNLSVLLYVIAIPLAFIRPWIGMLGYGVVAAMWFIPDKRIERQLA